MFPPFMEPEGSLQCSQESAIGPYPEPDESSPYCATLFLEIHFNILQTVPRSSE
jgi:hypothetical protein